MAHICVGKAAIIGSDNGLSPGRRQAIIWTNAGILFIGPLGANFSEILIEVQTFSLKEIRLKMLFAKCCPFRLGPNVLNMPFRHIEGWTNGGQFELFIYKWIFVMKNGSISVRISGKIVRTVSFDIKSTFGAGDVDSTRTICIASYSITSWNLFIKRD